MDLGNPNYNQSIGFAPQIGDGVTVVMFFGDQGRLMHLPSSGAFGTRRLTASPKPPRRSSIC